ncbi:glycine zipper domain-containing protein [Thermomonas haemolytica]|uniref:Outer membrane lipoprotein SlyB n=1 Tax=Thermomonas haemolytica TaxID=141949 RepID=A0A4R3NBR3_9GAMM|nr:hypothetical protein [Thermomonas haemolytica]TCT24519.1 outer membrane lipoprotein SlyB [Thermomonas haemolytica]
MPTRSSRVVQPTGRRALRLLPLALAFTLTACASVQKPSVYGPMEVMQKMIVHHGVITALREVTLQNPSTGTGQVLGGSLGGIAGSETGKGRGQLVGGVLGAGIGQAIGEKAEQALAKQVGLEITWREDGTDQEYVLVQAKDTDHPLAVGDRIRVVESASSMRAFKEDAGG